MQRRVCGYPQLALICLGFPLGVWSFNFCIYGFLCFRFSLVLLKAESLSFSNERALMLLLIAVSLGTSRELASAHQLVLIISVVRNQWY